MVNTLYMDSELLNEYIKKSGLKIGHIVNKLGISRTAFFKKQKGLISFKASEVFTLCDMLHISEEDKKKIFTLNVESFFNK